MSDGAILTAEDEALLLLVNESGEPIGARNAQRAMAERGFETSEASISRGLSRLDALGLTTALSRKGRVLTGAGRKLAEDLLLRQERELRFHRAMDLRSLDEVLEWVTARQLLEPKAVELATPRLTEDDLALLQRSVDEHLEHLQGGQNASPVGHEFHQIVMKASGSPIFIALVGSLFASNFLRVENTLDEILIRQGLFSESLKYHRLILDALRQRDATAAGAAMWGHLELFRSQVQSLSRTEKIRADLNEL